MKMKKSIFFLFLNTFLCEESRKLMKNINQEKLLIIDRILDRIYLISRVLENMFETIRHVFLFNLDLFKKINNYLLYFMINLHMVFVTSVLILLYYSLVSQLLTTRFNIITQCPAKKYLDVEHDDDACSICINQLEPDDLVRILPCEHIFHSECIYDWMCKSLSCPLCRKNIIDGYTPEHEIYILY